MLLTAHNPSLCIEVHWEVKSKLYLFLSIFSHSIWWTLCLDLAGRPSWTKIAWIGTFWLFEGVIVWISTNDIFRWLQDTCASGKFGSRGAWQMIRIYNYIFNELGSFICGNFMTWRYCGWGLRRMSIPFAIIFDKIRCTTHSGVILYEIGLCRLSPLFPVVPAFHHNRLRIEDFIFLTIIYNVKMSVTRSYARDGNWVLTAKHDLCQFHWSSLSLPTKSHRSSKKRIVVAQSSIQAKQQCNITSIWDKSIFSS